MFQSNRDIRWAVECQQFITDPPPGHFGGGYDETSLDLHLDEAKEAKVWDVQTFAQQQRRPGGRGPELHLGRFVYGECSEAYLVDPPEEAPTDEERDRQRVCRRGRQVIVKPGGFVLWTTKERVGTPLTNPRFIAFVNAKSTRARAGLVVHLTAPTIHAGWNGKITLEIANLGDFHFVLEEKVIAQLTVATISSPPEPGGTFGMAQGRPLIPSSGNSVKSLDTRLSPEDPTAVVRYSGVPQGDGRGLAVSACGTQARGLRNTSPTRQRGAA
jgi:dCTP deaminase